jgi:hypothetical protein
LAGIAVRYLETHLLAKPAGHRNLDSQASKRVPIPSSDEVDLLVCEMRRRGCSRGFEIAPTLAQENARQLPPRPDASIMAICN